MLRKSIKTAYFLKFSTKGGYPRPSNCLWLVTLFFNFVRGFKSRTCTAFSLTASSLTSCTVFSLTVSFVSLCGVLHSALRLRLTFAAQIGNESSLLASYHIYSGNEGAKPELSCMLWYRLRQSRGGIDYLQTDGQTSLTAVSRPSMSMERGL